MGGVWGISNSYSIDQWRGIVTRRKANARVGQDISIVITNPIADKIRRVHYISNVGDKKGDKTSLEKFCVEIIENFIVEHREGVKL